jgi:pimeloyl-ACP methyl ester carboxylesterase
MATPVTRYAKSEGVHVAYQEYGSGPVKIVFVPGFVSHIDNYWTHPNVVRWLDRLGSFANVVMFDKRGTGLSDRVGSVPGVDERMDDVRAVMDAVGWEKAVVFGVSEGGSLAALFAAHHPERCDALIIYAGFAQFKSWLPTNEDLENLFSYIDTAWGTGDSLPLFAPTSEGDIAFQEWWGRFERLGADPASAIDLMRMNSKIDITGILPTIHMPTLVIHRVEDTLIDFDAGELLAERIPDAKLVRLPGADHLPWVGEDPLRIIDEMEQFLTGAQTVTQADRVLATVVFTDIVDSTAKANAMGDRRWRNLMHAHENLVRTETDRFRGELIKSTGDGFLITFDAPARAIRCALAVGTGIHALGLEIRAGVHTGEIQLIGDGIEGISVNIASRIANMAGADEVLVSRTVKDLIAGSGIALEDRGAHALKGIPDQWELYRASL